MNFNKYIKYKTKYTKLTKQYGGNPITCLIKKYFNNAIIKIIDNTFIKVSIKCNYNKYIDLMYGDRIFFIIYDTKIDLSKLRKCNSIAGSKILEDIIKLAYDIKLVKNNLQKITLIDESYIILDECPKIRINYAILHILLTEKSWYNKYNFISTNYKKEQTTNNIIINLSLSDFLSKYIKIMLDLYQEDINDIELKINNITTKINTCLIKKLKRIFNEYNVNVDDKLYIGNNESNRYIILCAYNTIKNKYIQKEMTDYECDLNQKINKDIINLFDIIKNKHCIDIKMSITTIINKLYNFINRKLDCISNESKFIIEIVNISDNLILYSKELERQLN